MLPTAPKRTRNKSDAEAATGAVVPASLVSYATDASYLIRSDGGKEKYLDDNVMRFKFSIEGISTNDSSL